MVERSAVLAPQKSLRQQIILAVALVSLATAIRYSLGLAFGITAIFLMYHPAVFAAAWFGRLNCAIIATVLSLVAVRLFWIEPHLTFPGSPTVYGDLGLFLIVGVVQGLVIEMFQRAVIAQKVANEKLAEARAELEIRVLERTAELVEANDRLRVEIKERQQAEELERFYAQRAKALSLRLVQIQEAEHRRIARELHDEIGQNLTGLKVVLELSGREVPPRVREKFDEAQQLAQDLLDRVREMSLNLRPLMLDDLGLLAALPWFFERFTRQTDIRISFKHSAFSDRLLTELETTFYRITQEALANVARHSGAKHVNVRLWRDDEFTRLQIEDDGHGFDVEHALASKCSTGLSGMQERASLAGGELTVESSSSGTRITAELPVKAPLAK
jgi:signal transduction histidine kinase